MLAFNTFFWWDHDHHHSFNVSVPLKVGRTETRRDTSYVYDTTDVVVAAALAETPRCDWEGIIKPHKCGPNNTPSARRAFVTFITSPVSATRLTDSDDRADKQSSSAAARRRVDCTCSYRRH